MKVEIIQKIFRQMIKPLRDRVLLIVGRGKLMATDDSGEIQKLQVTLLADEVKDKVERIGQFGFTSNSPKGSDVVMVSVGANRDHGIVIAIGHRKYRITGLSEGDSAMFNMALKYFKLVGNNGEMYISKLKILNDQHEMVAVLSEFMDEVIKGLVFTAIGPQPWTNETLAKLQAVKDKLDTFKE